MIQYALYRSKLKTSIKGHSNNSLQWKSEEVPGNLICSRSFSKMSLFPHYKFCQYFFEAGEDKARKFADYCKIGTKSHRECFTNLPRDLTKEPLWWVMPWGGTLRKINFDIEKQKENKLHYTNKFMKLLKSVEKNKFILSFDAAPPVHKLCHQGKSVYVLQDGHHRSAIHSYLKDNNLDQLIIKDKNQKGNNLILQPTLVIHRQHIFRSKYCSIGHHEGHFSLKDAYAWFDLAFNVLSLQFPNAETELNKLISIHDKVKSTYQQI